MTGPRPAHLRVGIVGFGRMGRLRGRLVNDHPSMCLAAVADPGIEAADVPDGCEYFKTSDELLTREMDAVFVCTPNAVTADIVVASLRGGRHVFCEKPPGKDLADVQRMSDAERARPGLKLKFGFNHRYHDAVSESLTVAQSGRLGRLLWMRGIYGKSTDSADGAWRSRRDVAGGGILLDQGIHMLDLFRAFCGEFDDVKSFVGSSAANAEVEDNAYALLRTRDGQVAMLHSSATHWKHTFSLEIFLTDGYIAVNGILSGSQSYGRETLTTARRQPAGAGDVVGRPREEVAFFDHDHSWAREVDEFANCIVHDRPVTVGTSEDARRAMELVYRIYQGDESWWGRAEHVAPAKAGGPA